jgi:hypothetical protein
MPHAPEPIPRSALWLGTSGLVPLVVLTSALYALPDAHAPALLFWLSAYAAVMLAFVGAIHWGAAMVHPGMGDTDRGVFMAWSVVPALVGWVSLLLPETTGLLLMAATFAVHYAADHQFAQRFALPSWYLRLRASLTAVAALCLVLALVRVARH